jgi:protease I
MIIAPSGFRDEEYLEPKEIFIKSGHEVTTASTKLGECKGMLGAKVMADIAVDDIKTRDYDVIVFVGGTGSKIYYTNPTAHMIIKEAVILNKIVGAICIAPVTLANAGVLKGRKVTGFPSIKQYLTESGADYTGSIWKLTQKSLLRPVLIRLICSVQKSLTCLKTNLLDNSLIY